MTNPQRIARGAGLAALACAAIFSAGCGEPEPPRGRIHGTVKLAGKPLPAGRIRFLPLSNGIGGDAEIKNGAYEIPVERGLSAGRFRVEVSAEVATGRKVPDRDGAAGDMKEEVAESVPKAYNSESKLTIDFDPQATAPHDFDLK